ncbi:MAG: LAGLIDADG family homing endonuclease [Candidatus Pacebacteria bacterium]|nr:LAGLIDADG family homing endonuclease [Candidatus Paceibacterota bacterium]
MSYFRKQPLSPDKKLQSYIIGIALGDGNLSNSNRRAPRLRISCDKKYPTLIKQIINSISLLLPNNKVSIINRKNCIDISCYSNHWTKLLWNWDKGPKDKQNVSVPNWIKNNLDLSKECLRGLFQTDGSIYKDRKYLMVNFVNITPNLSMDVLEMINNLGYSPNLQKLKQLNGKTKYTIRVTKNSEKFIKEINFWKK